MLLSIIAWLEKLRNKLEEMESFEGNLTGEEHGSFKNKIKRLNSILFT